MKNVFRNKKNKKIVYIIILLIFIIISIFLIKNRNNYNEDIYKVHKVTVSDELTFAGIVDAERRVDLGFAIGGRVIKNNVKEGDFVRKGQILAEVDQSAIRSGLIQADANYQLIKIDTENKIKKSNISFNELKNEQDSVVDNLYKQYISGDLHAVSDKDNLSKNITQPIISGNYTSYKEGTYKINVYGSGAQSGYSFSLSGLENGTYTAEIYKPGKLGNLGLFIQFSPNTDYKNTEWTVDIPNKRSSSYLSRKTAYQNALAKSEKLLAYALDDKNSLIDRKNDFDISYSEAIIKNARAQLNANIVRLSDGKIRAPFDGYIAKDDLEQGETVQALISQITIFANRKRKIILNTPEIYINKLHLGDDVRIVLDAYPDVSFIGHIIKIDDLDTFVDGVPVYKTDVIFDNIDDRIRVGMNAHAYIIVSKKDDVLAVPKHFILKENNSNYVLVKNNDEIEKKKVTLGIEGNNGTIEVISGLSDGQEIVFDVIE